MHLVGTNHDLIVSEVSTLLDDAEAYERMSKAVNPYGDGKTCDRIVRALNGEQVERYGIAPQALRQQGASRRRADPMRGGSRAKEEGDGGERREVRYRERSERMNGL